MNKSLYESMKMNEYRNYFRGFAEDALMPLNTKASRIFALGQVSEDKRSG